MTFYGWPLLYTLFLWWVSTGVILYLNLLPQRTYRWSMLAGTAVLAVSLHGLATGRNDTSLSGAYLAFTYGLLAWGWHEMSFFMGLVTGPRTRPCPPDAIGWRRFGLGVQACLYHELAIIATAAAVLAATWGGANQIGMWTFMLLWGMRQSAKLNVFLGVLNLNEEFLPAHLRFLAGYMTKKPMNPLFPLSVSAGTVLAVLLVRAAAARVDPAGAAGFTFLAALTVLAVIEHWLLVLPLPFARLWNWSLRARDVPAEAPAAGERLTVLADGARRAAIR